MPSKYSLVHRQPNFWNVRFDDSNGWEAPHIHAKQRGRELIVILSSLKIRQQVGDFSRDEINEIRNIAVSYRGKEKNLKDFKSKKNEKDSLINFREILKKGKKRK